MSKLMGETTLIIGALQGIGEGIAKTFARHNANLILPDISPKIEKLADELCGHGHRCIAVAVDACDPASVVATIKYAKEKEGRIDILVNSAGVCRLGSFLDMSDEDRDFHIDINIKGVWNITEAVLPEMTARKDGRVVMMFSVTGDMAADPSEMACTLTKAVIVNLTKSLAVEYAWSGTHINAICPGYVYTSVAESIARQLNLEDSESVLTEMAGAIPMCRPIDSPEAGELATFPASDESSYLTGAQDVTGGGSTLPEIVSVDI